MIDVKETLNSAAERTGPEAYDNGCEHQDEHGGIGIADALPAAEPQFAAPSQGLKCAPETMGEVEPQGGEPYEVEDAVNGVGEGGTNPVGTVSGIHGLGTHEFGKHHVVPEVIEVQQHAEDDDDAEHEHVLAGPFHLGRTVGHSIGAGSASLLVLKRQHYGIDEMEHHKGGEAKGGGNGIPVGTKHFANHVIAFGRKKGYNVHATMKGQEQDEGDAGNRHDHLASDGGVC